MNDVTQILSALERGMLSFEEVPDVLEAQSDLAPGTVVDPSSVPAASATVFATVSQPKLSPPTEGVEFRFRRESGNPQWKLIGFGAAAKSVE